MPGNFGTLRIDTVENTPTEIPNDFQPLTFAQVKFVHYPDCQQLITWLPRPGREYGNIELINKDTALKVQEFPVADILNGSIQLLWDTLPIAPGSYSIVINWKNGCQHIIGITKYEAGEEPKEVVVPPAEKDEDKITAPIEYRDGFGKVILNEDILLREQLLKDISNKFKRNIRYEGNFRSGKIIYTDPETQIELYHEMGGGNCMFYIDILDEKNWEAQTRSSLHARKEILEYIAARVRVEQAPACRYEIGEKTITYYYK